MFRRWGYFFLMNLAVIVLLSGIMMGLEHFLGINVNYYIGSSSGWSLNIGYLALFALIIGFGGAFISLAMSKWMAKRAYRIEIITEPATANEMHVYQSVQRFAEQAGIGMPEVGIYESPEANAFATGARRNNALVAVSTGLLNAMNKEEVDAVLAHEVAHIQNGDMITMTLLQGVMNTFVVFFARIAAFVVLQIVSKLNEDLADAAGYLIYWVTAIVFEIIFGMLAMIVLMKFSRHREYHADAGSVRLTGSREAMISALQTLEKISKQGVVDKRGEDFNTMKISHEGGLMSLFRSHPTVEQRVEALEKLG